MTEVGAGGIRFSRLAAKKRFKKEYKKLDSQLQDRADAVLRDLRKNPLPAGLRFEKLKGYSEPSIYTVHVDGNYKISLEVADGNPGEDGCVAVLRRVATHSEIDRRP